MAFAYAGDGRKIYYEVHGEGPTVLCVGGWGLFTGGRFESLPPTWRDSFRIVVLDHPGLGQSDPLDGPASTHELAEDARAVLDSVGVDRAHAIGQGGLGAGVVQFLAAKHPQRVQRIVLSAGWAWPEPYHDAQLRALRTMRERADFEAFQLLTAVFCYQPSYLNEGTGGYFHAWEGADNVEGRPRAHLSLIDANIGHDARSVLGDIDAEALVVCGEDDLLGGPRLARDLASRIGNAHLLILEGVPHVYSSVPGARDRYAEAVRSFLTEGAASAALVSSGAIEGEQVGYIRRWNVEGFLQPRGYSHVAESQGDEFVHLAGFAAVDGEGNLVGDGDLRKQTEATLDRVFAALKAAGLGPEHVVRRTTFVVELTPEKMRIVQDVYAKRFAPFSKPAASSVGVTGLAREGMLIEVECTAVRPKLRAGES